MKRRKAALVTMIAEEELTAESKKSDPLDEEIPSWVIIDVGGDRFQARRWGQRWSQEDGITLWWSALCVKIKTDVGFRRSFSPLISYFFQQMQGSVFCSPRPSFAVLLQKFETLKGGNQTSEYTIMTSWPDKEKLFWNGGNNFSTLIHGVIKCIWQVHKHHKSVFFVYKVLTRKRENFHL